MRKLLFLLPVLFLSILYFYGCQENQVTDPPATGQLKLVNIENSGSGCTPIYAGQNILVGSICMVDDQANGELDITYTVTAPWLITEIHFAAGDQYADIPMNKKGNLVPGQFPYNYSFVNGVSTYSFSVPFSYLGYNGCEDARNFYAAAHCVVTNGTSTETGWGDGSFRPGSSWGEIFGFKITCNGGGDSETSETAFAYGSAQASCFLTLDLNQDGIFDFNRWGWTNGPLNAGTYTFDLYAGAGQCDLSKGTRVGKVTVNYNGSTAVVTFVTCGDYKLDETHLYVGTGLLPLKNGEPTVAPGQFPSIHDNLSAGTTTDTYTVAGLSGPVYVVAHAAVYGDYSSGPCNN